jgi:hypothetical protein
MRCLLTRECFTPAGVVAWLLLCAVFGTLLAVTHNQISQWWRRRKCRKMRP